MGSKHYDWSEYYQAAYEQEKLKNRILGDLISKKEMENELLQKKLERVQKSILGRCMKAFHLPGHIVRTYKKIITLNEKTEHDCNTYEEYQEELSRQKNPYGEWIRENEPTERETELKKLSEKDSEGTVKQTLFKVYPYKDFEAIQRLKELHGYEGEKILLFAENPACLSKEAGKIASFFFEAEPDKVLWYAQEDEMDDAGNRKNPWFKPIWSPDTLLGFFYFGSFFAVRASNALTIPLKKTDDIYEKIYDFCLKITDRASAGMTDLILYHRPFIRQNEKQFNCLGIFETTTSENYLYRKSFWGYEKKYCSIKQDKIKRLGFESLCVQTKDSTIWTVVASNAMESLVSVIIPSKDQPDMLQKNIFAFLERTEYQHVEFIVVDNGSTDVNKDKIKNILLDFERKSNKKFLYLYKKQDFNFSSMCNRGARASSGKYLLFLNDDIEVIQKDWLTIMVGQACLPGTGAVGAKLWYPEQERIQHAGITNMRIGPSHKLVTFPDDRVYYFGHNSVPYNMLAVTAACLLIQKEIYDAVGGFNENMAVAYNDVDFCFTLFEKGYLNVQRNDAVLYHHESFSRGLDQDTEDKWKRLLEEKEMLYMRHPLLREKDPFYNDNLIDNSPEYITGYQYPFERRLCMNQIEKKDDLKEIVSFEEQMIRLTLERIQTQLKNHISEPSVIFAEGWCYMLNKDNACYERWLILLPEEKGWYYQISLNNRYRYDVEAILPEQIHIELSGFTCRILKEDLIKSNYTVGILYQNKKTKKKVVRLSDQSLRLKEAEI